MLDVTPPHHAPHTWRDLFNHIATIVLGLLIAIGLEQSVEAIHHARQRSQIHAALRADTVKAIQDTDNVAAFVSGETQWLNDRMDQIDDALDTGRPLADPPPWQPHDFDAPNDPAWKGARSSGRLALLSQQEIEAYSEVEICLENAERLHILMNANFGPVLQFAAQFSRHGGPPDFSRASPEDLKKYRAMLVVYRDGIADYAVWCHIVHGAEVAILHGERDLNRIQQAER